MNLEQDTARSSDTERAIDRSIFSPPARRLAAGMIQDARSWALLAGGGDVHSPAAEASLGRALERMADLGDDWAGTVYADHLGEPAECAARALRRAGYSPASWTAPAHTGGAA